MTPLNFGAVPFSQSVTGSPSVRAGASRTDASGEFGERALRDVERHWLLIAVAQTKAHDRAVAGNRQLVPDHAAEIEGARTLKPLDRTAGVHQPERRVGGRVGETFAARAKIRHCIRRNRHVGTVAPSVSDRTAAETLRPSPFHSVVRSAARDDPVAVARPSDIGETAVCLTPDVRFGDQRQTRCIEDRDVRRIDGSRPPDAGRRDRSRPRTAAVPPARHVWLSGGEPVHSGAAARLDCSRPGNRLMRRPDHRHCRHNCDRRTAPCPTSSRRCECRFCPPGRRPRERHPERRLRCRSRPEGVRRDGPSRS